MLLQYRAMCNNPTSPFISRGGMHFSGAVRLFDQLCTNERRKEGDALVGVKTLWHCSRSWCLFEDKRCLEMCVGQ